MPASLIQQLEQAERDELTSAWNDYAQIVRRPAPLDGDAARLRVICEMLQITSADVRRDMTAWAAIPDLEQKAVEADELRDQMRKAGVKLKKRLDKYQADDKKAKDELRSLRQDAERINQHLDILGTPAEKIERLRAHCWRIFGTPKPRPVGEGRDRECTEPQIDRWLSDQPPSVCMEHTCDVRIRKRLLSHGYTPGAPGVWSRVTKNGTTAEASDGTSPK